MSRLLILSDIHGNYAGMHAILMAERYDQAIFLGDYVGYCSHTDGGVVLRMLGDRLEADEPDILVAGNHEHNARTLYPRWIDLLDELVDEERFSKGETTIWACHWPMDLLAGEGRNSDVLSLVQTLEADVLLFGHSHKPEIFALADGTLAINPGAVMKTSRDVEQTFAVIDLEAGTVELKHLDNGGSIQGLGPAHPLP